MIPRSLLRSSRKTAYLPAVLMAIVWVFVVLQAEWWSAGRALAKCEWPGETTTSTRVALVADPQLVDDNTYPTRSKSLLAITKAIVDRYLARNWRLVELVLDPDSYLFLGDLFDGGREWTDDAWLAEYARWNRIFPTFANKRTHMSLPGNHDIGFGDTVVLRALQRFIAYFGPTNSVVQVGGFNMVFVDTISLSDAADPAISKPVLEFLDQLSSHIQAGLPNILYTHVPLYRPKGSDCGRHREGSKELSYTQGYQYVTQVSPELTDYVLKIVQPVAVFSGDDHDACHVVHSYTQTAGLTVSVDEYTVKSFSMAMGVHQPGLQLLTVDGAEGSYYTSICLLGDPFGPFKIYGLSLAITLALVVYRSRVKRSTTGYLPVAEREKTKRVGADKTHTAPIDLAFSLAGFIVGQFIVSGWIYHV